MLHCFIIKRSPGPQRHSWPVPVSTLPKIFSMPQYPARLLWVDVVRGIAIVLMIIFHFCYDLRYFGYVDWSIPNGPGWRPFRYIILSLFIFTLGLSLSLAHAARINTRAFGKRLLQIFGAATAVTLMSLFLFPKAWIYFGILHFMLVASLLGLPLVSRPRLALLIGCSLLIGYWLGLFNSQWPFILWDQWLPQQTEDFVPLFPWLGVMYLGIAAMAFIRMAAIKKRRWDLPNRPAIGALQIIGQHGLLIYLAHQPLLFAGFLLVKALFQ